MVYKIDLLLHCGHIVTECFKEVIDAPSIGDINWCFQHEEPKAETIVKVGYLFKEEMEQHQENRE